MEPNGEVEVESAAASAQADYSKLSADVVTELDSIKEAGNSIIGIQLSLNC